jgi:hypothetical protein
MKIGLILALLLIPIASAISDLTPPSIVSFDFKPKMVDVSKSDQTITVIAQLEDNLSGIWNMGAGSSPSQVAFASPSSEASISAAFWVIRNLVSGGMLNGTYKDNMTLPRGSASGKWHLDHFILVDNAGNKRYLNETEMKRVGFPTILELRS